MSLFDSRRLLGVISPMIVWAGYFVAVYALQGLGCTEGWHRESLAGVNVLSATLGLLSLTALAAIARLGRRGWTGWRHGTSRAHDAAQREKSFGLVMVALAVLAFVSTALIAIPILMVPPCL